MTNELKIDIQRTGFPVKIGEIELWFDSSLENLKRFLNVEEIAKKQLKEAQEKAKHVHFPEEIKLENLDMEVIDVAFDVNKEFIAAQYDIIFGDGTFKKIYKKYPDIFALENALDPLGSAIAERIEKLEEKRVEKVEKVKKEALKKQASKKQMVK